MCCMTSLITCLLQFFSGTCINNTSVMMFKKGSFEVSDDIYPVAIKVCMHVNKYSNFEQWMLIEL